MKSLTRYFPRRAQFNNAWEHLKQLNLADDNPAGSDPIDIFIGAKLSSSVILDGVRKETVEQPLKTLISVTSFRDSIFSFSFN